MPLIAPHPVSRKAELLVSPQFLAIIDAILLSLFAYDINLIKATLFIGGIIGAIVGKFIAPLAALILGFVWYEFLQTKLPYDTFVLLDIVEVVIWFTLSTFVGKHIAS